MECRPEWPFRPLGGRRSGRFKRPEIYQSYGDSARVWDLLPRWERYQSCEFGSLPQPAFCPAHEGRLAGPPLTLSSPIRSEAERTYRIVPADWEVSLFDSHSRVRPRSGVGRPAECPQNQVVLEANSAPQGRCALLNREAPGRGCPLQIILSAAPLQACSMWSIVIGQGAPPQEFPD